MASSSSGALGLLSAYDSNNSDSEDEVPGPGVSVKRTIDKVSEQPLGNKKHLPNNEKIRLPLPTVFLNPSHQKINDREDTSEDHNGRIRSFPHERGNWASYVYIGVDSSMQIQSFVDVIVKTCDSSLNIQPSADLHISLTRTVILKHHWIDIFSKSVQDIAKVHKRFLLCLGAVRVYCNEERTRTFISVAVTKGEENALKITRDLDKLLADFKLPSFYEEASFHLSLAWCIGDHVKSIEKFLPELQSALHMFIHVEPFSWSVIVENLQLRIGNKYYVYSLQS